MVNESDIQEQLSQFLASEQSIEDFEDWLVVNSSNNCLLFSDEAKSLIGKLDALLFQWHDKLISFNDLKSEFQALKISVR